MSHSTGGRQATAIILIGLGVLFLLGQFFNFSLLGLLWPLFIVLPGVAFLYAAFTGDRDKAGLIIPGAMVTGTGAILFYQNLTGHWESWAYVWALYPVFLGLALVFIGRRTSNEGTIRTGDGFVKWGLIAFVALWALFELFIFGGNKWMVTTLLPLVLIAAGAFMLLRSRSQEKFKVTRSGNGYHKAKHNGDTLQEKIDAALTEDDDQTV